MHLDYAEFNGNCSILIFAPPKRYLMSRKCVLKCLDPFSRTLAEASDAALCHQRSWLCSCRSYNSMFWLKKKIRKNTRPNHTPPKKPQQPPQSKPICQLLRSWDLWGMSSFTGQEATGQGQIILLRDFCLYRKSWDVTCWNFNNISCQLSFEWFEIAAKTIQWDVSVWCVCAAGQTAQQTSLYLPHAPLCCFQIWLLQCSSTSGIESSKRNLKSSRLLKSHQSGMLFSSNSWNSKLNSLYMRASLVTAKDKFPARFLGSWLFISNFILGK